MGLPTVNFTGYTGFFQPGFSRFYSQAGGGKVGMNLIRGSHSISFGYEFQTRQALGQTQGNNTRGGFTFNGQYTGDGFADYFLGLPAFTLRSFPLGTFGMSDSPYSGLYVQDFWKISPNVTLNLGLRWEYWHEKAFVNGNGSSFSAKDGKVIAGEDNNGQVNLDAQPGARDVAKAFQDMWIPASQAGVPAGLFEASGYLSPRVGVGVAPGREKRLGGPWSVRIIP